LQKNVNFFAIVLFFFLSLLCEAKKVQQKIGDRKKMEKFTLYLGLNDKDTKTQKIATLEAYKIVTNLLAADFGGGTIYEAQGIYKHDDGTVVTETTLRIEILFATRAQVLDLIATLKKLFNQESVALQTENVDSTLI
jgi:hypothetical protein